MKKFDLYLTAISLIFMIVLIKSCVGNARADDSMANPANRIAKSLEDISQTLKSIDRKLK